jgi:hypothetical protein
MRPECALIAVWQGRGDRLASTWDVPDLADKADDLHLEAQVLDDQIGASVAHSIRREGGRVYHTGVLARHSQGGVLFGLAARSGCTPLGFRGVVGCGGGPGGWHIWFARAALQVGQFVAQLLVLGTELQ